MTSSASARLAPLAAALLTLSVVVSACSPSSLALTTKRTQGYVISDDALAQIRNGQSQQLVLTVLGSPQFTNEFTSESAWYYVQTNIESTAFGLDMVKERRVLAIYFDKNMKVKDRAVYGLQDGRSFAIESRRTPSFGEDKTFIDSILSSFGSV